LALSERFEMRLETETLDAIDRWREQTGGMPSRAEAIRRLVDQGLAAENSKPFQLDGGQRLITLLLCDLFAKLKVPSDLDPDFIREAILDRHDWAIGWRYTDIAGDVHKNEAAQEVSRVLHMWIAIEIAFDKLSEKEKARVTAETDEDGRFPGFDWNMESDVASIATFMIDKMDLFSRFRKRDLRCVFAKMPLYLRMLTAYKNIASKMTSDLMSASQLIAVLNAQADKRFTPR
jgi:uncharacterized protein YfbU (UPF0304 family)